LKQSLPTNIFDKEGIIFNIQKFSIHDGPGIRTTIFLKGCPLNCLWCSNPEGINSFSEIMTNFEVCIHCNHCISVCSKDAIEIKKTQNKNKKNEEQQFFRRLNRTECNSCMQCVEVCTSGALQIIGKSIKVRKVIEVIKQDLPFYKESGGGVTLSGGEPLYQFEFALSLLKVCKKLGIHTAIDTSGNVPTAVFKKVLPFLDLILFDIKHTDSKKHYEGTGVVNDLILQNLKYLNSKKRIWLRVPLIPSFNDDEQNIMNIIDIGREMSIEKIYFLPYHQWGVQKYEGLGRIYQLSNLERVSESKFDLIRKICKAKNFTNFEIEKGLY
jgi:pyruvate formate lyase activating enzyme